MRRTAGATQLVAAKPTRPFVTSMPVWNAWRNATPNIDESEGLSWIARQYDPLRDCSHLTYANPQRLAATRSHRFLRHKHMIFNFVKILPGGVRAGAEESLFKQRLLVLDRAEERAPNLSSVGTRLSESCNLLRTMI
jgi:hypothetical protein